MARLNKKGFYPLYTTLGLLLVIMVIALTIQWNAQGDKAYKAHIDRLSWLRINMAVENVRMLASSSLKNLFHEAIVRVGKIGDGTVNPFLNHSREDGWDLILDNISDYVSRGFKKEMPKLADFSDGHHSTFIFDEGINITLGEVTSGDIGIRESEDGLLGVVRLPMTSTNRYHGWETKLFDSNITIPLRVRLKDMYERAWDFHQSYYDTVSWTFSAAIYARAYMSAYLAKSGPLLKEAHYDFDPIATLLFGDLDTIKEFSKDVKSALDIGAVPAATWFAEWQHLSEPSFLPAGFDMSPEDKEKAQKAISNNYRMGEIEEEVCGNLTGSQRDDCRAIYDIEELERRVDYLKDQEEKYEDLLDDIDDWLEDFDTSEYEECKSCGEARDLCEQECERLWGNRGWFFRNCKRICKKLYKRCRRRDVSKSECREEAIGDMRLDRLTCDEFREEASELIESLLNGMAEVDGDGCRRIIDAAREEHTDDVSTADGIEKNFEKNEEKYGLEETEDYCRDSINSLEELEYILNNQLTKEQIQDVYCEGPTGDCDDNRRCEEGEVCYHKCDYFRCPFGGESYECLNDRRTGTRIEMCKKCWETRKGRECDYFPYSIRTCECRCRGSISLVMDMNEALMEIRDYIVKTLTAVSRTAATLEEQLERREKADQLAKAAEDLEAQELGYDVFSRLDTFTVEYDKGEAFGRFCYFYPTFRDRDKGVCGDSVESVIVYTIQVAAAALATMFSGGAAAPVLDFAKNFFPLIYESEVRYNLTETLIDDSNRVMLTNIAGPGAELYTYAPFEFEIYKDREFSIGSATFGRTMVYVYLPAVKGGMQRVLEGLLSPDCAGDKC